MGDAMREPEPVRLLLVRHAQADRDGADPALTDLGRRQGVSQRYLMPEERMDLELWKSEHGFPGGETLGTFRQRVGGFLDELTSHTSPGATVALVTHSGVIEAAVRWIYGIAADASWVAEIDMAHVSITEMLYWPKGRRPSGAPTYGVIRRMADVSFLPKDLVSLD
jgi:broad specificity phosphatase PhoE